MPRCHHARIHQHLQRIKRSGEDSVPADLSAQWNLKPGDHALDQRGRHALGTEVGVAKADNAVDH